MPPLLPPSGALLAAAACSSVCGEAMLPAWRWLHADAVASRRSFWRGLTLRRLGAHATSRSHRLLRDGGAKPADRPSTSRTLERHAVSHGVYLGATAAGARYSGADSERAEGQRQRGKAAPGAASQRCIPLALGPRGSSQTMTLERALKIGLPPKPQVACAC